MVHAAQVSDMVGTKLLWKDVDNTKEDNSPWWMTGICGIYANGYDRSPKLGTDCSRAGGALVVTLAMVPAGLFRLPGLTYPAQES